GECNRALVAGSEDVRAFEMQWDAWRVPATVGTRRAAGTRPAGAESPAGAPVSPPAPGARVMIGCDFGSTTAKAAVLSDEGELLFTCYAASQGNPIEDARALFRQVRDARPLRGRRPAATRL